MSSINACFRGETGVDVNKSGLSSGVSSKNDRSDFLNVGNTTQTEFAQIPITGILFCTVQEGAQIAVFDLQMPGCRSNSTAFLNDCLNFTTYQRLLFLGRWFDYWVSHFFPLLAK
jgi:hypothetical protein